ncbi:unnamed protein product [Calicophoron daubneyi]|uniref:Glycine cleavage system P protein n=1 Tax=Calicophoron daubneyi TaxID=300641 RepID=A0AAV2TGA1_CALDB
MFVGKTTNLLRQQFYHCGQINCHFVRNFSKLASTATLSSIPDPPAANFCMRQIGPSDEDAHIMLRTCGYKDMEDFVSNVIPQRVRMKRKLDLKKPTSEAELLQQLKEIMDRNQVWRSYIGQGYYGTLTPTPIMRNVFENPGWYTSYTPYQAEISQGRLEALLNFQTLVSELTGLDVANASLLDEGTAAAESMTLACRRTKRSKFLIDKHCHPQTRDVVFSRADGLQIEVSVVDLSDVGVARKLLSSGQYAGCLLQYPDTEGNLCKEKISIISELARENKALTVVATDLLALTIIQPPGKLGADVALGSSQRFGIPLGFGGPHAAFFAVKPELVRQMPGRLIGISKDSNGQPALRLTLQAREQHIRRDKATSNICTAQALLASMASFYAVYHGPTGLQEIAARIHNNTLRLAAALIQADYEICNAGPVFDTLKIKPGAKHGGVGVIQERAEEKRINLRYYPHSDCLGVSLDETITKKDFNDLLHVFGAKTALPEVSAKHSLLAQKGFVREDEYLTQAVFHKYHSETSLMRYMKQLENKDVSLTHSMIPLGSCTLKLNSATIMQACSWPSVNQIHPFVPQDQTEGYRELITQLEKDLAEITGYDYVCMAPISGAHGEYAGLRTITGYLKSIGQSTRKVCLIPTSAHGTNPASAAMAGFTVQPVRARKNGEFDMHHLNDQISRYQDTLGAIMITYPSTYGVFDDQLIETIELVHKVGAQVYLDGANSNAQVGLCRPGDVGADVSHLNLHKTFGIPHGGGGPGVGPICVKKHLAPFLPQHRSRETSFGAAGIRKCQETQYQTVSSAPFGSASLFPITWSYLKLLGPEGLKKVSQQALLNANYMRRRLEKYYPIKFVNEHGCCAHEFIVDCEEFEKVHVTTVDIAKRLIDYGFHSPTMSWPVHSGLMIEPTESESLAECDRLCDALIGIRMEIDKISNGQWKIECNPLKMAPHTVETVTSSNWDRPYTREEAAYPGSWQRSSKLSLDKISKIWPSVGRVDEAYGDTHLMLKYPRSHENGQIANN